MWYASPDYAVCQADYVVCYSRLSGKLHQIMQYARQDYIKIPVLIVQELLQT